MTRFDRLLPDASATRTLTLDFARRCRSRQRLVLDDGGEAVLTLPRGLVLRDGDVLGNTDGQTVRIRAATETTSTAAHDDAGLLLRAAYHLGNRHVPVQIGPGWLRYLHDHVLDAMCRGLGLSVAVAEQPFEPEDGAYAGGGHHHHAADHPESARHHGHD